MVSVDHHLPRERLATRPEWAGMAEEHQGAQKVPTLRNVELTAPYLHTGEAATLIADMEQALAKV